MDQTILFILLVGLVGLLIGLSKGGLGAVLVSSITPLLSFVLPVSQAVSVVLPFLIVGDIFAMRMYWKEWDNHLIRLMLPMSVVGVVAGSALLATLPDHMLRRSLGVFTLVVVLYKPLSERIKSLAYRPQNWHGYLAGWASGFGSALANVGAPPFTAYMLLQKDISPKAFIGTTTLFFTVVNALKVPGIVIGRLLDMHLFLSIIWALPLVPFGVWLGRKIITRINPRVFERFMLLVLFQSSLVLLFFTPTAHPVWFGLGHFLR